MSSNASAGRPQAAGDRANPSPVMLDVNGVAELLGVSARHVRRLVDSGKCPQPVRLGGCVRWPRPLVESWIADGCPKIRTARAGGAR
jgi:excisionase family DNA binding protein